MQKEFLGLTATGVSIPPSAATVYRPYVVNGKWKCPPLLMFTLGTRDCM